MAETQDCVLFSGSKTDPDVEPARLIFTAQAFVVDSLIEGAGNWETALLSPNAISAEVESPATTLESPSSAEQPVEEESSDIEAGINLSDVGSNQLGSLPVDNEAGGLNPDRSLPSGKNLNEKKQPTDGENDGINEGAKSATVKKSTLSNRKRRAARKQSEARLRSLQQSLMEKALAHSTTLDLRALPHAASSYLGSHGRSKAFTPTVNPNADQEQIPTTPPNHHLRLQELLAQGYTLVDSHSAPDLIFDGTTRLGAWKPGSFGQPGYWDASIRGLSRSFQTFVEGTSKPRSKCKQKRKTGGGAPRGTHTWTKWGYSHGGGEQAPMSTAQLNQKERRLWKDFLACPHFKAVTKRLMESFEMWAPDVYKKYDECHRYVISQMQALDCINAEAPLSVPFAALTANLGPQTVCYPHRDIKNLANGMCVVLVLGLFNHRYGGHIVLHEARLVLEMKPGDALFLPSAVVTHETIPIQPGETRYSLVFYSAGGLFRWKDCESRTNRQFAAEDRHGYEEHFSKGKAQERWEAGWSILPTLEELLVRCGLAQSAAKTDGEGTSGSQAQSTGS